MCPNTSIFQSSPAGRLQPFSQPPYGMLWSRGRTHAAVSQRWLCHTFTCMALSSILRGNLARIRDPAEMPKWRTVVFELITHSVPTVDQFLRVEWTAAFPLWTLNLAQRDTVHGARCALPPTSSCLYQLACTCTGPIPVHEFCALY